MSKTTKKTNNGKKKSQSKQPKATSNAIVPRASAIKGQHIRPYGRISKSLMEKVCGVTDPFCDAARGARWTDGNSLATVPYSVRGHAPITTFSNGTNIVFCTPVNAPFNTLLTAGQTAGIYTLAASPISSSGVVNFPTYFTGYRVVTAGIVIRSLQPVSTTSGYLIVTRTSSMPLYGTTVVNGNCINSTVNTYPIQPGMEIPIIFRPLGIAARDFVQFTSVATTQLNDPSWDVISIEMIGGPNAVPTIDLEYYYNYEMELPSGSVLAATMSNNVPPDPVVTQASGVVSNALVQAGHSALNQVGRFVLKAATAAVAARIAGPAAGRVIMDVD
jgi:hypothetical protein